jgi:hypothetical protein
MEPTVNAELTMVMTTEKEKKKGGKNTSER